MFKLRFLVVLFFALLIFSFLTFGVSPGLSSISMLLSAFILTVFIFMFVHQSKKKEIGKIKIEEVSFARNFVFRSYFKAKDLWIVYDKREKAFRPADFRDMPLKVGITFIFSLILLYISYLIFSNLFQFPELLVPRTLILIIIGVIGFYDFFISIARIAAMMNKKNKSVSKLLNKNRSLKNFLRKQKAYMEVTPNLTLDGSVTSVEIITHKKYDTKRIEKILLDTSRKIR